MLWRQPIPIGLAGGGGVAVNAEGFIDYNDASTAAAPLALAADVWTDIPNDGAGPNSNSAFAPHGVTQLLDVATGYIDATQTQLGNELLVRNDFTVVPQVNNVTLEFRYMLGAGANAYPLTAPAQRLDRGAGVGYQGSLVAHLIYVGNANTRDNPIKMQVKLSSAGSLVNAGTVISLLKGGA